MIMQVVLLVLMMVMGIFQTGMMMQASWFNRSANGFCEHTRQQLLIEELVAVGVARLSDDQKLVGELREKKVIEQTVLWHQPDARSYRGLIRFKVISPRHFELEVSLVHIQNESRIVRSPTVMLEVDESLTHESGTHITMQYQVSVHGPSQPIIKS